MISGYHDGERRGGPSDCCVEAEYPDEPKYSFIDAFLLDDELLPTCSDDEQDMVSGYYGVGCRDGPSDCCVEAEYSVCPECSVVDAFISDDVLLATCSGGEQFMISEACDGESGISA